MPGRHLLLTVNAGSASVKLALFDADDPAAPSLAAHQLEGKPGGAPALLREFTARLPASRWTIAHRVVHGGARLPARCLIDAEVEAQIEALASLAPLHNPPALAWIRASRAVFGPSARQVAVFDTGYYRELPDVARTYALPRALCAQHGLRRYGFHGLAHQAMVRRWLASRPATARGARIISLQLGGGCSVTASRDGRAQDTSMGFSPLEGLVMATRGGDLDAGLLLYLLREAGLDVAALDRLLSQEAGLKGVSGRSGDMRELLAADDDAARLAIALYCYRARKYIGAYLAVLGGADAILFGGGVGEPIIY